MLKLSQCFTKPSDPNYKHFLRLLSILHVSNVQKIRVFPESLWLTTGWVARKF
jgi:hypothetical protein